MIIDDELHDLVIIEQPELNRALLIKVRHAEPAEILQSLVEIT
jgi:hypothetical protein